jgi:hypothetical protein
MGMPNSRLEKRSLPGASAMAGAEKIPATASAAVRTGKSFIIIIVLLVEPRMLSRIDLFQRCLVMVSIRVGEQ